MEKYNQAIFMANRKERPISEIVYRLTCMAYKKDKYCIIEGSSDQYFYSNIKCIDFNKSITEFLYNSKKNNNLYIDKGSEKRFVGKNAVIQAYYMINKNDKLSPLLNRCYFIVDKDYYGLNSNFYHNIDEEMEKCFSITKYHSFENYFLTEENIRKIFDYLEKKYEISIEEYEKYYNKLMQFVNEISEYNRLKSSIVAVYNKNTKYYSYYKPSYKKKYSDEEIFNFDFKKDNFYNKEMLLEEVEILKKAVFDSPEAKAYFENESIKFEKNKEFIRGHNIYNFFEEYLKQVFELDILRGFEYGKIVSLLNVEMDFHNGIGEVV